MLTTPGGKPASTIGSTRRLAGGVVGLVKFLALTFFMIASVGTGRRSMGSLDFGVHYTTPCRRLGPFAGLKVAGVATEG